MHDGQSPRALKFLKINCFLIEINLWSFETKYKTVSYKSLQQLIWEFVSKLVIIERKAQKRCERKTEILDPTGVMFCLQQPHKILKREKPKTSGIFPNLYLGSWPSLAPRVSPQIPRGSLHSQSGTNLIVSLEPSLLTDNISRGSVRSELSRNDAICKVSYIPLISDVFFPSLFFRTTLKR